MTFYAKALKGREGTYEYHVITCLEIVSRYLELNHEILEQLCPKLGVPFEELAALCYRAAFFHDMGKLGDFFQNNMRSKLCGEGQWRYFRHELLSARLLYQLWNKRDGFPYDVWAVLGHHKKLDLKWTSFSNEMEDPDPVSLTPEQISFGLDFDEAWREKIPLDPKTRKRLFEPKLFVNDEDEDENWVQVFLRLFHRQRLRNTVQDRTAKPNRTLAVLLRGILRYADWQSSAEPKDRLNILHSLNSVQLNGRIRDKMNAQRKSGDPEYAKRPFQAACEAECGNVLAIAPTGSGKTEASLLWATNRGPGKVLFLMPTRVTSNSLYERIRTYFDPVDCGISHSGAGVYLALKMEKEPSKTAVDEESKAYEFRMLRQYKAFMAPVMVATVDQFLTASFNIGDWFSKELAAVGASVIFDEIHAYDSYTLALITESIRRILELEGRVMVMSATMPRKLREHFQDLLCVEAPIVAEELMNRRKCSWEYSHEPLEAYDKEILQSLKQGHKVAVVVNTVKEAQNLFRKWKNLLSERLPQKVDRVMCYHSNFIMRDRDRKERCLLENKDEGMRPANIDLLIATQVIEVSLDISFDLMFSECAPLDDLIQRAGRCNRFGKSKVGRFVIFSISDTAKKYVYKDAGMVLQRTAEVLQEYSGLLSEHETGEMLEKVYRDFQIYNEAYIDGQNLMDQLRGEISIVDRSISDGDGVKLTTRAINIVKIPVVPLKFLPDVNDLLDRGGRENLYKIAQFEVPIAVSYFKKFPISPIQKKTGYLYVCEIGYDEEIGVKLQDDLSDGFY